MNTICKTCEHHHYRLEKMPDEVYQMSREEYINYINKIPCRDCKWNYDTDNYSEKLKTCPFCGGEAIVREIEDDYGRKDYTVECPSDECTCGIGYYETKQEAIKAWNRRSK